MGKTDARPPSEASKKRAFQLSRAPIIHGREERQNQPDEPYQPSTAPATPSSSPANRLQALSPAGSAAFPASGSSFTTPAFEDLGPLPATYGSDSLFLIARDPEWFFCYWDIDWGQRTGAAGSRVVLKMFHSGAQTQTNRGFRADSPGFIETYSAEITHDARDWYISTEEVAASLHRAKGDKGGSHSGSGPFYAEIGYLAPDGSWDAIARSNATTLPLQTLSEESTLDCFATIPFHLAFQTMLELVNDTIAEGERLGETLSRLQGEGRQLVLALSRAPRWTPEQRHLLAALLGNELESLLGLSPEEVDTLLRKQLQEHLSSASVAVQAGEQTSPSGSFDTRSLDLSSSSSAIRARWDTLEGLHSLTMAVDHTFWSSWLSSWKAGAAGGASSASSASSSLSSSTLSGLSSFSNLSSSSHAGLSSASLSSRSSSSWLLSWAGGGGKEALSSSLSSWLSSWPEALGMGMQESAFWSSWLSSWSSGAGSQWGESSGGSGSGGMSSFNLGSSWSAHPSSRTKRQAESGRDFHLHLNAEVIFYGGTHPEAQLWVDGRPVALQPDGTFRFHFTFPDGDTSVPIVAQSPDGLEQRSATLRLARGTARRAGEGPVGQTPQPAHLSPLNTGIGGTNGS